MSRTRLIGMFALGGLALGCPESEIDHRTEVLEHVGQAVLLDLEQAHGDAQALRERTMSFCVELEPTSLAASQAAWMQLRGPWKRIRALPFGPLVDEGFDTAIDFWPARPSSIEGGISSGVASLAELGALGVASKGMPAIEYLLWDPIGGDEAVLARFTGDGGLQRCAYLILLAYDVQLRLEDLDAAWRGTNGFADQLANAGESEAFPTVALAVDQLLNAMIAGLHDIEDPKLRKPLGVDVGAPQPELLESRFSDRSLQDARDGLDGFAQAYLGDEAAPGLTLVVARKSAAVDQRVRDALAAAQQALADVPEPLQTAIVDAPAQVEAAADALHELRTVLTAEVASLLGVTVSLSDNDGD